MDAFYASVEQRDDPSLKGRPVAVGGSPESRGVVAAASYEARTFGVRSAIPMARAVRLCPELVILRPNFKKYAAVSEQVFSIFRSVTPLVEPLSLDEAYLDVTENAWGEALGVDVARRLKARIHAETQLTASAGVAPNKFLAKIASGWKKPDGLTVIAPERIERFLQKPARRRALGRGPRHRAQAARRRHPAAGRRAHRAGRGPAARGRQLGRGPSHASPSARTTAPVNPNQERKSIGCEETYAKDLADPEQILPEIDALAAAPRPSRAARASSRATVTSELRYSDFQTITRSDTREPSTRARPTNRRARPRAAREDGGRPSPRAPARRVRPRPRRHTAPAAHTRTRRTSSSLPVE